MVEVCKHCKNSLEDWEDEECSSCLHKEAYAENLKNTLKHPILIDAFNDLGWSIEWESEEDNSTSEYIYLSDDRQSEYLESKDLIKLYKFIENKLRGKNSE